MTADFREFLRARGETIASRGREAGFFGHRPTSGTAHEMVLREPLEEALPAKYGITAGEARAVDGSVSSQWDVLIYDRLNTPKLFQSEGNSVLPVEGVVAAISVKSMINKAAIQDAADSAERLRTMPRRSLIPDLETINPGLKQGPRPAVFLFGFQGPELETIRRHTREACQGAGSPKVLNSTLLEL